MGCSCSGFVNNSDLQMVHGLRVNTFKYLGATLAENGDLDAEMTHRVQSGWQTGRGYRGLCATEE